MLFSIFSLAFTIFKIREGAVQIGIIADHDGVLGKRDRNRSHATDELGEPRAGHCQRLWPEVDDDQLLASRTDDTTAKKSPVVWLVIQDEFVALGHVARVSVTSVVQSPVGEDPKDKVRTPVRQLFESVPAAAESPRKKRKHAG